MPTTRPRYQVTDTGLTRAALDRAAAAWPELANDRKALLLRTLEHGAATLEPAESDLDREVRKHAGEWVAIRHNQLLMTSTDGKEILDWVKANDLQLDYFYRVPESAEGWEVGEHGGLA